jgi:ABC-2 type transport system ATP-binding protein
MIFTENLSKVYNGEVTALNGLNLKIPYGEIFGLLGPNGAGKTTTARVLSCILEPSSGEGVVADLSIRDDQEAIRKTIGLLSENPSLYERLSARRNLELIGRLYGLTRQEAKKRANHLAEIFDFKQNLEIETGKLSKGNKHKVAIARAMLHEPKVLFLDEPTSSLDPEMSKIVRDTIEKLTETYDVTVLICTHNLPEAEKLCDRVGIIDKGNLITVGTPKELIKNKTPDSQIHIELVDFNEKISSTMKNIPNLNELNINKESNEITFSIYDPKELVPKIVRELVQADAKILSVFERKKTLEDVYFDYLGRRSE